MLFRSVKTARRKKPNPVADGLKGGIIAVLVPESKLDSVCLCAPPRVHTQTLFVCLPLSVCPPVGVHVRVPNLLTVCVCVCLCSQRMEKKRISWRTRTRCLWSLWTIPTLKTRSTTPTVPSRSPQTSTRAVSTRLLSTDASLPPTRTHQQNILRQLSGTF